MTLLERKKELLNKYAPDIITGFHYYTGNNIPKRALKNAKETFARGVEEREILGFYDTTLMGTGKNGYILTDQKIYFMDSFGRPHKYFYDDMEYTYLKEDPLDDRKSILYINFYDKKVIKINTRLLYKKPLKAYIDSMIAISNRSEWANDRRDIPETTYFEIPFYSHYCANVLDTFNSLFNEGKFLYDPSNTFYIEVPLEQYLEVVELMREAIQEGKIPGIDEPEAAESLIRQGLITFNQAKHIAARDHISILKYDPIDCKIIMKVPMSLSYLIIYATHFWDGRGFDASLKQGILSMMIVGGQAFFEHVAVIENFDRYENPTYAIKRLLGMNAYKTLVRVYKSHVSGYGLSAVKNLSQFFEEGGIIRDLISLSRSAMDLANNVRGRISTEQMAKNIANTFSGIVGGTAGWVGGAAAGSAVLPGVGTMLGGMAGAMSTAKMTTSVSNTILSYYIEDDAVKMMRVIQDAFEAVAEEYLLNEKEVEKAVDLLYIRLTTSQLKDMQASKDRYSYAKKVLVPIVRDVSKTRRPLPVPTSRDLSIGLMHVWEEIEKNIQEDLWITTIPV